MPIRRIDPPSHAGVIHVHHQDTPSAVWAVTHPLPARPAQVLVRTADGELLVEIAHLDTDLLRITFPRPCAGTVHLRT